MSEEHNFSCTCGESCSCTTTASIYSISSRGEAEAFWEDLGRGPDMSEQQAEDETIKTIFGIEADSRLQNGIR